MGSECQSFDLHRREESNGETGKEAWTRSKQASNQAMQKIWSEPSSLVLGHGQHGRFLVCGEEAEEPSAPLYKLEVLSPDEEDKPIPLSNTCKNRTNLASSVCSKASYCRALTSPARLPAHRHWLVQLASWHSTILACWKADVGFSGIESTMNWSILGRSIVDATLICSGRAKATRHHQRHSILCAGATAWYTWLGSLEDAWTGRSVCVSWRRVLNPKFCHVWCTDVHSTKTQIRDSDPNRRRGSPATLRLTAIPWETVSVVLLRQGALKVMVSLPTNGFVYSIWPDE